MYLDWHLGWWRFCGNIKNKQSNTQTQHKPPKYLPRNPRTWRIPPKRTIFPPPPTFLLVVKIIFFSHLFLLFITIINVKSMTINNDQTIYPFLRSTNLLLIEERVVWSTRGWVTGKGEPWDLRVLAGEYSIGSCWWMVCGFENIIVGLDICTVCMGDGRWTLNVVCTRVGVKQGLLVFIVHSMNVVFGHWEWVLCV